MRRDARSCLSMIVVSLFVLSGVAILPAGAENLGAWNPTTNYPIAVGGESCVTSSGYEYCVGGNSNFQGTYANGSPTNASYYAQLLPNGVGAWTKTTDYPFAVSLESCVADSGYIYCVGGSGGYPFESNAVYYAAVSPGGIGAWTATTSYPNVVALQTCVVSNGYIYCIAGNNGYSGNPLVYFATISSTGVGTWSSTTSYPISDSGPACVAMGGYVYCVAGASGSANNATYYAQLSPTGVGTWSHSKPYPELNAFGLACVGVGNYIYCLGGCVTPQPGCFTTKAYYSQLSRTGFGKWVATSDYPMAAYDFCVSDSSNIYCLSNGVVDAYYSTASPGATLTYWSYGWVAFSGQLNFLRSKVIWSQPLPSELSISYVFAGAMPNSEYRVGIALLYHDESQCRPTFGQFKLGPCLYVTGQGVSSWEDDTNDPPVSSPGVGTIATDGSGAGTFNVKIVGIKAGNYTVEFYANSGSASGTVNFQAPGPFGTGVSITAGALTSPDSQPYGHFGSTLAAAGGNVVVSAPQEAVGGQSDAGGVYLFNSKTGSLSRTFASPNPSQGEVFGASVGVWGSVLAVGAPGSTVSSLPGAGKVYLFDLATGHLIGTLVSPAPEVGGQFGSAVGLSSKYLAVGAQHETANGYADSGHVYVFNALTFALEYTFATSYPINVPKGECGCFGGAVSISGNGLAVASPYETVGGDAQAGRAYVFNLKHGSLALAATSPSSQASGFFGYSVELIGGTLVAGAPGEQGGGFGGAGQVHALNASTGASIWSVASPNPQTSGYFGFSLSGNATNLVVGAPQEESGGVAGAGSAYEFSMPTQMLVAELMSLHPSVGGDFGISTALSSRNVAVGADMETVAGEPGAGHVYVF